MTGRSIIGLVCLMVACVLLGAFLAPQEAPATTVRVVQLDQWDLKVMRQLLRRTCAIRQFEDGSGTWEKDDDERLMCREVVSQIGRT